MVVMCFLFCGIGSNRAHNVPYYYYRMLSPLAIIFIYRQFDVIPHKLAVKTSAFCIFFYGAHFPVKEAITAVLSKTLFEIPFMAKYLIVLMVTMAVLYIAAVVIKPIKPLWRILAGGR